MIPISEKPKRFVAALNKFRKVLSNQCQFSKTTAPAISHIHLATGYRSFSTSEFNKKSVNFPFLPTVDPRSPSTSVSSVPPHSSSSPIFQERDVFERVFREKASFINNSVEVSTSAASASTSTSTWSTLHGQRSLDWYTGKPPVYGVCPGVTKEGLIKSLPLVTANAQTGKWSKKAIQDYFDNTWTMTEVLLGCLQGEEAFVRPPYHELRHPMIFYYGHPAVLYINKFRVAGLISEPINPYFESIFETGVDEMSWDDLSKNKMPWPSVTEVQQYRSKVYETVTKVIQNLSEEQLASTGPESPLWAILMGMEHERIHIETSSVLINELPLKFVQFPKGLPNYHPSIPLADKADSVPIDPIPGKDYPINEMITIPGQRVALGKPKDLPSFGWDNEYGYREYEIPSFRASKFKISNGEFLAFVKENGYARQELWSEQGWKWRSFRNAKWPTFWMRKGPQGHHQYDLRVLFDIVGMPWNWPVVANYHEAVAFANWKSLKTGKKYRILTELEHRAIRDNTPTTSDRFANDHAVQYGGDNMHQAGYNLNMAYSSMSPVDAYPANSKGFHDVFGNAWEWMEDYFCALPGFEIHPYYEDFSTPCFDGLHQVIQGGSFISTGDEASAHSRFHFRPHFFQHASFRLVEQLEKGEEIVTSDTDAPGPFVGSYPFRRSKAKMIEQQQHLNQQQHSSELTVPQVLSKHFGFSPFNPQIKSLEALQRAILSSLSHINNNDKGKLLEVGCGPGGLTFPLINEFKTIIGIDHNNDMITIAKRLLKGETMTYSLPDQGEQITSAEPISITARNTTTNSSNVEFRCADPMCLPAEFIGFDCVIVHDVLDKMSSPNALLGRLGGVRGLVRPGGMVIVISAFQWTEDRTPKSLWLGGLSSSPLRAEEQLSKKLLSEGFEEKNREKVPVMWFETSSDIHGKVYSVLAYQRKM